MASCWITRHTPATGVALAGTLLLVAPRAARADQDVAKAPDWPNLLSAGGRQAAMMLPKSDAFHLEPTLADLERAAEAAQTSPQSAKERYERWLAVAGTPPNVRANDPTGDQTAPAAENQSECAVAAFGSNVVVAFNDSKGLRLGPPITSVSYAYSCDGGQTFTDGGNLPLIAAGDQAASDPTLDVDNAGNFYLGLIYLGSGSTTQDVAVYRGTFSGCSLTWGAPSIAAQGAAGPGGGILDKSYLCINPVDGNVYMAYTRFASVAPGTRIEVVRGTALGTTWNAPVVLDVTAGSQAARPFVGPEGNLYVCWAAGWGTIACDLSSTTGTIQLRRSTNPAGAFAFAGPITVGTVQHNWTSYWGGNIRNVAHYMPDMGVDRSGGPHSGTIYVTWNEAAPWPAPVGTGVTSAETEPNNAPADATIKTINPGDDATGSIGAADIDYWKISLTSGQHIMFRLEPQGWNCPVTGTLRNFEIMVRKGAAADTFLTYCNLNQFASEVVFDANETTAYFFRIRNVNTVGTTTGTYRVKSRLLTYGAPSPARDMRDIVCARSTNLGLSFTPEVRVNDDAANLDNEIPAITVDALGKVHVFYYDCRDAVGTSRDLRSYYRNASFDGGVTWQPGHRISNELNLFNLNTVSIPNYGEYNQAATARGTPSNIVHATWSDERISHAGAGGSGVDSYVTTLQSCITVTCAPDTTVPSDTAVNLSLCIQNCGTFAEDVDYTISDSQGWCAPLVGSVNVTAGGSSCIPVACAVPPATPDSTEAVITLVATARSCPSATDTCTTTITVLRPATDTAGEGEVGPFFGVRTAHPNPFASSTSVSFRLDRERLVRMRIYNLRGELVRTLRDGRMGAGLRVIDWDGNDGAGKPVSAGVYLYRLEIDGASLTRKVIRMQ